MAQVLYSLIGYLIQGAGVTSASRPRPALGIRLGHAHRNSTCLRRPLVAPLAAAYQHGGACRTSSCDDLHPLFRDCQHRGPIALCVGRVGAGLRQRRLPIGDLPRRVPGSPAGPDGRCASHWVEPPEGHPYVVLPQALRLAIPAWSNEVTLVLKDSTLVYVIGVPEILRRAEYVSARTLQAMLAFGSAALIYWRSLSSPARD